MWAQKLIDVMKCSTVRSASRVIVLDTHGHIGLIKLEQSDMFFPPDGGVERQETLNEAAQRAVSEELGVTCESQRVQKPAPWLCCA
jgi:8-oxo-dGTP pyrophosphatase MutT (NUDIX family)